MIDRQWRLAVRLRDLEDMLEEEPSSTLSVSAAPTNPSVIGDVGCTVCGPWGS